MKRSRCLACHLEAICGITLLTFIPENCLGKPLAQCGSRAEPDLLFGARGVQASARLTVWLACIPTYFPVEPAQLTTQFGQVPDGDFPSCSNIERFRLVILFGSQNDRVGRVTNKQKLARRRTGTPGLDVLSPVLAGFDSFANQRGDDMARGQVEIVLRTLPIHVQKRDYVQPLFLSI